jgi:hypothetical protein
MLNNLRYVYDDAITHYDLSLASLVVPYFLFCITLCFIRVSII